MLLTKNEREEFVGPLSDAEERPILRAMLERWLELGELLEHTDDDGLYKEWAALTDRLPFKRNSKDHMECAVTMGDRMQAAGDSISDRAKFLRRKGRPGAPRSADLSILALEKHLEGESYPDIARDLCGPGCHTHENCADSWRKRVDDLMQFFKQWGWEISRTPID
jgi:hypothetical protein